ncbi:toxin-antitoxin system, antitoxin component, PHD family [delta proteobacterium NaphS2]|nr:toxin-antitoxin system, antitoxin component, PHD family [delta proteobacterium NaphS2]
METVGAYEAKTHLSKLLDRVQQGEQFIIAKHGTPVAVLKPADPEKARDIQSVISEILNFRKKQRLDGLNLREMIEEGRR